MATVMIRQVDEVIKQRLRVRAAERGHSMEAEARDILRRALTPDAPWSEHKPDHLTRIRGRWKGRITTDEVMKQTRGH